MAETTPKWTDTHTTPRAIEYYNNATDEVKALLDANPDYTPDLTRTGLAPADPGVRIGPTSDPGVRIGPTSDPGIRIGPTSDSGMGLHETETEQIPTEQVTEQVTTALKETPEEKLTRLQLEQLQEETEWNQLMRPVLLRNMGLTEDVDATTGVKTLRQMTEDEKIAGMTPEEKSAYETERLISERNAKAARGELETPGYITDELSRQREIQQNVSSQRLGAKGANLSTAGINAKVNQFGNEMAVKNAYQYGQEGTGMGLLSGYNQYLGNQAANNQNVYGNFSNAGMGLIPMAQTAAQPYTFGRQLNEEQGLINQQRQNAFTGGLLSAAGTVASMYLTKGMGGSK